VVFKRLSKSLVWNFLCDDGARSRVLGCAQRPPWLVDFILLFHFPLRGHASHRLSVRLDRAQVFHADNEEVHINFGHVWNRLFKANTNRLPDSRFKYETQSIWSGLYIQDSISLWDEARTEDTDWNRGRDRDPNVVEHKRGLDFVKCVHHYIGM